MKKKGVSLLGQSLYCVVRGRRNPVTERPSGGDPIQGQTRTRSVLTPGKISPLRTARTRFADLSAPTKNPPKNRPLRLIPTPPSPPPTSLEHNGGNSPATYPLHPSALHNIKGEKWWNHLYIQLGLTTLPSHSIVSQCPPDILT